MSHEDKIKVVPVTLTETETITLCEGHVDDNYIIEN